MNYSELQYANDIVKKKDELAGKIRLIDDLKKRIDVVNYDYQKEIKIQLAEGFIETPQAYVPVEALISFLEAERERLRREVKQKENELFAFCPEPYDAERKEE